ncbi:hypothetical protein niasHT_023977 [Heterodera trifolii]|uniref:RING-type domain-containing protein n=1 Tax=Heterodera trifolii TaxID=157864 RepID=A0ABD2JVS1_9BILA
MELFFALSLLRFFLANCSFILINGAGSSNKSQGISNTSKVKASSVKLADLFALDPLRVTLADLIKEERNGEMGDQVEKKRTLAELIKIEKIREDEFDQLMDEMRENERLVEEVFEPQQQNAQQIQKNEKMFDGKEEKYRKIMAIKEKDPLLGRIMQKLQLIIKEMKGGQYSENLKEYLQFVIDVLALRKGIPSEKIVPLQNMSNLQILASLIQLYREEKMANEKKRGNFGKENPEKSDKRMEQMLQLLRTAIDNKNGHGQMKPKRRKKRDLGKCFCSFILCFFVFVIMPITNLKNNLSNAIVTTLKLDEESKISRALDNLSVQNNNTEAEECPICLESFELGKKNPVLKCSHMYHKKCITEWMKQSKNICPMCRADLFKITFFKAKPIVKKKSKNQPKITNEIHSDV